MAAAEIRRPLPDTTTAGVPRPGGKSLDVGPATGSLPTIPKKNVFTAEYAAAAQKAGSDICPLGGPFPPERALPSRTSNTGGSVDTAIFQRSAAEDSSSGDAAATLARREGLAARASNGADLSAGKEVKVRQTIKANESAVLHGDMAASEVALREATAADRMTCMVPTVAPPPEQKYTGCIITSDPSMSDRESSALWRLGYVNAEGQIYRPQGWEWREPKGFFHWGPLHNAPSKSWWE